MDKILLWRRFTVGLRTVFSHIPVLGPLTYCRWKDHKACLKEMFIILLFSTATFWLTSALLMSYSTARTLGYLPTIISTIQHGELFIFTVGFIGPILLQTADDKPNEKAFPGRTWHLLTLIILGLLASGFHTQTRRVSVGITAQQADIDFLFHVSLILAAVAIILRYLAMVYRKSTAGFKPREEMKQQENDFTDAYMRHAQGEEK